ncbi:hypothetical protein K2Q16_02915 [Patescibacteria group bacterium]|nr:hypothetical protein [Patescibacteria group bacterium]
MQRRSFLPMMVAALAVKSTPAGAHGPQYTPAEAEWMMRQYAVDGMKCCAPYDFFVLQDPEWRMNNGHYEIRYNNEWHRVPAGRMMRHNPQDPTPFPGITLLFRNNGVPPTIYCFFPPPLM